jgi:glyoxylase-like metal-dependent hydrolase (beta-lactamase superfamily II)
VAEQGTREVAGGDLRLGSATVLIGERGGKYPHGNSLLVRGGEETVLIDPSLGVIPRRAALEGVDRTLHSHCHEDHVAGLHLFPDRPALFHELDAPGMRSLDAMMAIYGYPPHIEAPFRRVVVERFHWAARPDAQGFGGDEVFELGGGVAIRAIHAPGHTRGHCLFHVLPDDVLYLGDIDLSSFGPYYGDAWSDLLDFERTLAAVRRLEVRWYATFHHVGVLDGRAAFLERLDRFAAVIGAREARLLEYLREPRSLAEIAERRFVYRPGDPVPFAEAVERRSMHQHLVRLVRDGRAAEVEPGRWLATRAA